MNDDALLIAAFGAMSLAALIGAVVLVVRGLRALNRDRDLV